MRPTPASSARDNSDTDLLLPWKPIFSGGKPAVSAAILAVDHIDLPSSERCIRAVRSHASIEPRVNPLIALEPLNRQIGAWDESICHLMQSRALIVVVNRRASKASNDAIAEEDSEVVFS